MALTNNVDLAERMGRLRSHGITRNPAFLTRKPDGPWYYEQIELGFNYRMTDLQAALGLSQLSRLDGFIRWRSELAARYDEAFASLPVRLQQIPPSVRSARHLYVVRVPAEHHLNMFQYLRTQGIGVNLHYIPVHLQPAYRRLGFREGQYPQAEAYYREAMSLPLYPAMTDEQHSRVVSGVVRALALPALTTP